MQLATSSSTAAEYIAAGIAPEVAALLLEACRELGIINKDDVIPIVYVDSQPVLQGIKRGWAPYEPLYGSLTKAAKLRLCTMAQLDASGVVSFKYVPSSQNLADGLTKILDANKTEAFRKMIKLV